ncbi:MAG: Pls/PosA family non-ribosomal peptide synthetase, partial [Caulobacteraceae bacterium]
LLSVYLRCLGANIGKDVFLGADFGTPDLVSIGDRAIVSDGADLATTHVEGGMLRIGSVKIGADAFVGDMAIIGRDGSIGAGGALEDLSALSPGGRIGESERWSGSPARRIAEVASTPAGDAPRLGRRAGVIAGLVAASFLLPFSSLLPIAPGMAALTALNPKAAGWDLLPYAPLLALSYVVCMCLLTAAVKWALLGRIKAGRYSIWSGFYVRYWFVERLNAMALDLLHPIFATLYVRPWYRLLGARVGKRCELSSASAVSHDLIDFGEESFIADGVSFGAARMERGALRLAETRIGRRTFIGNSALLPTGAHVADGVLIGVLSKPPEEIDAGEAGATWFGSPPLRLPNRPTATAYSQETLFHPSKRLIATRLGIEYLRITLSLTVFVGLFCAMLGLFDWILALPSGLTWLVVSFPAIYLGFNICAGAIVLALKWLVIGRYRGRTAPLWSLFVWRSELVTSTYETLVAGQFLGPLQGTPYINIFLRLMGCRIGKRVFTDTTDITEFDLVRVGDDAALNAGCGLQTHLFEDRVMKLGPIDVGRRAAIGRLSIVLYDSVLEEGARLGDLSVVMKGETLPADTSWEGSPAQSIAA